jgi:nitrous oxidase accessory protein
VGKQKFLGLLFSFYYFHSFAAELNVGKNERFHSIHEALIAADSGDVINVSEGIYKEGEIIISKPVSVCGKKNAVVDGELKTQIFTVTSSHVNIEGFTLQNSGYSDLHELAGVRLENVNHCIIVNNHLINNFFGIYLANSTFCKIKNNVIEGNAKTESSSGNGIHLWKSSNNEIQGNHVSGHRDGIYFEFVKHSVIISNLSEKNLRYGLHFMFSDDDSYQYNTFRNNGSGVAVMYTQHVLMSNNIFENNWGSAAYGLLLKEISYSEIVNNTFRKNTIGIYMEGSSKTKVLRNKILHNGWGLRILGDCSLDTLIENNFMGNTFDVSTNATVNLNYFHRNYWENYSGYDLNHDQVGDVPYHPVSLFSKITGDSPYALMLLHSFFVDLMDQTEKVIPTITPEQFRDDAPLMKPLPL